MSDRSKDELADALARLSAGEVDPNEASQHGQPAPSAVPPPAGPKSAPPQSPASPANPPAGAPPRPAAPPAARRPAAPGQAAPAAKPSKPALPVRPATPGAQRPAAPPASAAPARSARPSVPGPARPAGPAALIAAPAPEPVRAESAEATAATDDDDAVIVPAAPLEYLGHAPVTPHRHKPRSHKLDLDSLTFRRTTIPIFLTAGVLLIVAGTLRFVVGTDAPLSDLPAWIAFVAWGAAVFMIGGAVMNMMRVKNQLDRAKGGDV